MQAALAALLLSCIAAVSGATPLHMRAAVTSSTAGTATGTTGHSSDSTTTTSSDSTTTTTTTTTIGSGAAKTLAKAAGIRARSVRAPVTDPWGFLPPFPDPVFTLTAGPTCDGTQFTLSCFPGDVIIDITAAFYGRSDTTTCPYSGGSWATANTGCTYATALAEAKSQCKGLDSCTPVYFSGDPCYGTYKYRTATFKCSTPPANQYSVRNKCDGLPFTLSCPAGSTISSIVGSFFGRSDDSTCPYLGPTGTAAMANTTCILPSFGTDLALQCVGQASCTPTFNVDPCPGTYKWKTATYKCS